MIGGLKSLLWERPLPTLHKFVSESAVAYDGPQRVLPSPSPRRGDLEPVLKAREKERAPNDESRKRNAVTYSGLGGGVSGGSGDGAL